jgi:hypothetical protein
MKHSCCVPLGLIVNELITNAIKYAFPGDRAGKRRLNDFDALKRERLMESWDDIREWRRSVRSQLRLKRSALPRGEKDSVRPMLERSRGLCLQVHPVPLDDDRRRDVLAASMWRFRSISLFCAARKVSWASWSAACAAPRLRLPASWRAVYSDGTMSPLLQIHSRAAGLQPYFCQLHWQSARSLFSSMSALAVLSW